MTNFYHGFLMLRKFIYFLFILLMVAIFLNTSWLVAIYYNNRGIFFMEKEEYTRAIEYFYKALMLRPQLAETHYNLAVAFEEKYDYERAIVEYKKALELNPELYKAGYNLALLYYQKMNLYEDALREIDELLKVNPHYQKAKELKEEVIMEYVGFCLNSGLSYLEEKNFLKAEEEFKKALSIKPDFVMAKYNLAILYLKKGEKGLAKEKLKEIIQKNSEFPFSYRLLGSIYFDEGNFSEAKNYYQEVIKLMPNDTQAYNDLAQVYTKLGEYDKAIDLFQKALFLQPDNLTILYGLASTYRDKGDYKNAISYYKKLQNLNPGYPFVESDLRGIYAVLTNKKEEIEEKREGLKEKYDLVYLKNGRIMRGKIITEERENIVLRIKIGESEGTVKLSKKDIEKIEHLRE